MISSKELQPLAQKDYKALDKALRPVAGGKYRVDEAWAAKQNDVVERTMRSSWPE